MTTTDVNHQDRLHALCSASGAERWLNCPGSVGLSLQVPPEPSGPSALEGTRAHELAEKILRKWDADGRGKCWDAAFVQALRPEYMDTIVEGPNGQPWSMVDYALSYVSVVIEEYWKFDNAHISGAVAVRFEFRLVFDADMKMFGTADCFMTGTRDGAGYGVVIDLKYGKKKVKTEDNPQLAFYATSLKKMSKKKLENVKVTVVQPRIGHWYSETEYDARQLDEWNMKLTLGAEKALLMIGSTSPKLVQGGWCWFCPARQICPEKLKGNVTAFEEDPL